MPAIRSPFARRGRGGLPIAAPDGASPRPPQPLFPPLPEDKQLYAFSPDTTELTQGGYRRKVRDFLASSAFFPVRKKAKPDLCRFSDEHLSVVAKPFVRSAELKLGKYAHAPDELFIDPPKKRAKRARQADVAVADAMIGALDEDDDDDENAGADEGEAGKGGEAANAGGAKKAALPGEEGEEEEEPEEDEDEGDYGENYFDNGEDYDEKESGDDEPFY